MNAMKLAIPMFAAALAYGPSPGLAVPILGPDLTTFAVLGASTVTNTNPATNLPAGPTTITGNVGVWSSGGANAITGFAGTVAGTATANSQVTSGLIHSGTTAGIPNAMSAQGELTTAIGILNSLAAGTPLGVNLSGLTLAPGIYDVDEGVSNLTGTLTLDGLGNANAFWLFQMDGTLITSPGSVVNVINTGAGAGVFWNVRSSATIDTTTSFQGNILALTSISLNTGATIGCGRALADVGAVTMDTNTIGIGCTTFLGGSDTDLTNGLGGSGLTFVGGVVEIAPGQPGEGTIVSVPGRAIPEPGTLMLLGFGLAGLFASRKRLFPVA